MMSYHLQRTSTLKSCYKNNHANKQKNELILMNKPTYESTRLDESNRNENEDENKNDELVEFVRNLDLKRKYTIKLNGNTFYDDLVSNDYRIKHNKLNKCLNIHQSDKNQLKIKRKSLVSNAHLLYKDKHDNQLIENKYLRERIGIFGKQENKRLIAYTRHSNENKHRLEQVAKNENQDQAEESETNGNKDPAEQGGQNGNRDPAEQDDTGGNRHINVNGRNNNHQIRRKKQTTPGKFLSVLEHQQAENNRMMTQINNNISALIRTQTDVAEQLKTMNKVLTTIAQHVTEKQH